MPRKQLETHFFYGTGDDEIQVDSNDRKFNKEILKLKKQEPDAVYIIDDDNAPAFLRAAVKFENVTLSFHPKAEPKELTEAQKNARSENGKRALENNNLKNQREE